MSFSPRHSPPHRTFCPVLSSAGPRGGWMAFAFEGAYASIWLHPHTDHTANEIEASKHAGQQVVDHVMARHGVSPGFTVHTDLTPTRWLDDAWRIPLAVQSLLALRDSVSGLAHVLDSDGIHQMLMETGLVHGPRDRHFVQAAMEEGIHVRVDPRGSCISLAMPEAAIVWIHPHTIVPTSAWTRAQGETYSTKRLLGAQERIAANMLRASCGHSLAVFDTMAAIDIPESLYAQIPGWLPAQHVIQQHYRDALTLLLGCGPDMLIVAEDERTAAQAAQAAQQRFQAHTTETTLHAWSTRVSNP